MTRIEELKALLKDKTKTRTEKDLARKEIAAEKKRIRDEKINAKLEKQRRKQREEDRKKFLAEQERLTKLIRENPYFVFEGKDRWVDIRVERGTVLCARFRGKAYLQVPAAMKAAAWISKHKGRCAVIDQAEEGRLMVHFDNGQEDVFE